MRNIQRTSTIIMIRLYPIINGAFSKLNASWSFWSHLYLMRTKRPRTRMMRKANPKTLAITMAISQVTPNAWRKLSITQC